MSDAILLSVFSLKDLTWCDGLPKRKTCIQTYKLLIWCFYFIYFMDRKTCKNCGCKAEDHEVEINESVHDSLVDSLLHMSEDDLSAFIEIESENEQDIQTHPILKDFVVKNQVKERKTSRLLPPPVAKKPSGESQGSSMTEHKDIPDEGQEVSEETQHQEKV